jgi:ABC-2 type transport system ATP-binding protein
VKSYRTDRPNAVDKISFKIEPGTVFGLLGPNGAGKTTTIKMILGLVIPTSGSIYLVGHDISRHRRKALSQVGTILEGARNIYWRLSARANLEYFGALRGLRGKVLTSRIDEMLDLVELSDRADEEARYLSRGMQQKVALAAALLHDPDVLLLDEPTIGLDVHAGHTIEGVIRNLVKKGKTVLLTTHQMALAQRLCDRIFVINKGKRVVDGTTTEVVRAFGGQHQSVDIRLGTVVEEKVIRKIQRQFSDLSVDKDKNRTILTWVNCTTQGDLIQLLNLLDTNSLPIEQVGRREATLEEVFVLLTSKGRLLD